MRKEPIDRFMEKVRLDENGCVFWASTTSLNGYGQFWDGRRLVYAHRWAYEYFKGPIPDGLQLDHLCRNRNCANPAHLEPVTQRENIRRGDAGAHLSAKTHCPQGHEYAGANLYVRPRGGRDCRICRADRQQRFQARQKASR